MTDNKNQIIKYNNIGSKNLADYLEIEIDVKDILHHHKLNYQDLIFKVVINVDDNYLKIYKTLWNCSHCIKNFNHKCIDKKYIEFLRRYKTNFINLKNKMNLSQIKKIINYLIFIQLEMFDQYGFIWKKMSPSNIFIEHCNQTIPLVFNYNNKYEELKSNTIIAISDFEYSIFLDPTCDFINYYIDNKVLHTDESNSLITKLYNSFILGLELSSNNKILNRFINQTEDIKQVSYIKSNKLFNKYKIQLLDYPDDKNKWSDAYNKFKIEEFKVVEILLSYCWECFDRLVLKSDK